MSAHIPFAPTKMYNDVAAIQMLMNTYEILLLNVLQNEALNFKQSQTVPNNYL